MSGNRNSGRAPDNHIDRICTVRRSGAPGNRSTEIMLPPAIGPRIIGKHFRFRLTDTGFAYDYVPDEQTEPTPELPAWIEGLAQA